MRVVGGTLDDFTISFLHFSLLSTGPLGLGKLNTCPFPDVVFPASSVFLVFFPLSLCLARRFRPDLMYGRHARTTSVCVSLRWSGGLRVVRLPAGSWHLVYSTGFKKSTRIKIHCEQAGLLITKKKTNDGTSCSVPSTQPGCGGLRTKK